MTELHAAAFGGLDQIGQRHLAVQKLVDPVMLSSDALGTGRFELPGVEEAIDQRLERIGAGPERQKAPLPAVLKHCRPSLGRRRIAGPSLTLERRQNPCLRHGGLAHARIADQHRQPARRGERLDRRGCFPNSAEEIIAVLLLHRFEAAIGRRVAPEFGRARAAAERSVEDPSDILLRGRVGRDDPVQLAQKRQARRDLPLEQNDDQRERPPRLHPALERLVVFGNLPLADAVFADKQNEGVRRGQFLGELRGPGTAGAQVHGREEDPIMLQIAFHRGTAC